MNHSYKVIENSYNLTTEFQRNKQGELSPGSRDGVKRTSTAKRRRSGMEGDGRSVDI